MKIKIIIANNNDILYYKLSNIALKTKEKIEIIYTSENDLESLIRHIKTKKNLIILDSTSAVTTCKNILKNTLNPFSNIIILVINSKNLFNIINEKKQHSIFTKQNSIFSLLHIINLISDSLNGSLEIEKNIENLLWKLGLGSYFKGTTYLKDAISFAYTDKKLLLNTQILVKKVAEKNKVLDCSLVRSVMDKTLNNTLDLLDINVLYDIFGEDYDGRKISLRYFIDLCIRYIEKHQEKNIIA